jgi:DNA-binding GntR family transcriptional regulator
MQVLACAGFEWGVENLTGTHVEMMRQRQKEFIEGIRTGNVVAGAAAGADFSTIVILASGNRELQSMVDLVVARTTRILAQQAESDLWEIWMAGHDGVLEALERGDTAGALQRYRQIYVDYRARVETLLFEA